MNPACAGADRVFDQLDDLPVGERVGLLDLALLHLVLDLLQPGVLGLEFEAVGRRDRFLEEREVRFVELVDARVVERHGSPR